jgi:hypothetical protein
MDANHDGYIDVKELKGFLRLMQLQDWHRSGSVTWRIGHTGIEKMMKACEVRQRSTATESARFVQLTNPLSHHLSSYSRQGTCTSFLESTNRTGNCPCALVGIQQWPRGR